MKYSLLLLLALFSYDTYYPVQDYKCHNNNIKIKYQDTWHKVNLFNVTLKEDICSYIQGDLTFTFENSVVIKEPYEIYLFSNNELIQKKLIQDNKASIKINSPAYKYDLKNEKTKVIVEVEDNKSSSTSLKTALLMISFYIVAILYILRKKKNDV